MAATRAVKTAVPGSLALVTGSGSGIGRATALALAERGATVVCVDLHGGPAEEVADECRRAGAPGAASYQVDVADALAMAELARRTEADHGVLDILVNNAGVGMTGRFASMTLEDWDWIRSINLDGVITGCWVFGRPMAERGRGQVVNLSSGLAYTPTATDSAYVTTKAGVLAFSQCLRADWASQGVGVTAVCPGVINTPIIDATRFLGDRADPEAQQRAKKLFRRGHSPDKVAAAIVDAIERNRAVVPVGWEAQAGWVLHRLAPLALQQALAKGAGR